MYRTIRKLGLVLPAIFALSISAAPVAHAVIIPVDTLWVIDRSGSMGNDITQIKARIVEFNTAMINAGIDSHYGLVSFGNPPAEALTADIQPFATFNPILQGITANLGGTERGSEAINVGLTASFRPGAITNVILVTDEDDDSTAAQRTAAIAGLTGVNALLNVIGNPNNQDIPAVAGGATYTELAQMFDGNFFSIDAFRADPAPFFTNFINTKVTEIITRVPEPGTVLLLGLGLLGFGFAKQRRAQ